MPTATKDHTDQSVCSISSPIESPERIAIRERRRQNVAKARAAKQLKAYEREAYEKLKAERWVDGVPPPPELPPNPPPGLFPNHPVFDKIWQNLLSDAERDADTAKILVGIPALLDQAKVEAAANAQANANIPEYLREHDPIIAMGLQILDCGLADVARRVDLDLPLSPLEQAMAQWITGRKGHAPTFINRGKTETAAAIDAIRVEALGGGGNQEVDGNDRGEEGKGERELPASPPPS